MASESLLDSEESGSVQHLDKHAIIEQSTDGRFVRVSDRQFNEEIGRSECKVIYRGVNLHTGCEVSWHCISLTLVDPGEVNRIVEEMRRIARLDHPNIVRWQAFWVNEDSETMVLISDLMPEGSLRQYLKKIKVPRERVVKLWTQQLLQALTYLHSLHPTPIVHNHLKPDSIYVIPNTGRVVVGGLCKSILFRNAPVLDRKYEYMAPERQNDSATPGVDVYALGMTVLEICSQCQPYGECANREEIHRKAMAGVQPEALERILNKEAKDFIVQCIKPVGERPSAIELLKHKFVTSGENRDLGNGQLRVKTRSVDFGNERVATGRTVDVELTLPGSHYQRTKRVGFSYNLDTDTPDSVAAEMVTELGLTSALTPERSRQISDTLHHHKPSHEPASTPRPGHKPNHSAFDGVSSRPSFMKCYIQGPDVDSFYVQPNSADRVPKQITGRRSMDTHLSAPVLRSSLRVSSSANDENDVIMLQTALNRIFGAHLLTSGVFGRKTEEFVKKFQEMERVLQSGVVTEELWEAIWRKARERTCAR